MEKTEDKLIFKSFEIKGLFGDRDVIIPYNKNVKILIGENGLGKTTILNIIFYTITNRLYKLRTLNFDSLCIEFADGEKASLSRDDINNINDEQEKYHFPRETIDEIANSLTSEDIEGLTKSLQSERSYHKILNYPALKKFRHHLPPRYIVAIVKGLCGVAGASKEVKKLREKIKQYFQNKEILYFPTFRRIEEDLFNLGFDEEKLKLSKTDNRLIQFGMRDVRERFNNVKNEINILSSRGLSQISSEILSQLVKGVPNVDEGTFDKISSNDIEIILARVGDAISQEDKNQINEIVSSKKLRESDDKYLIYFLQKLIQIYEQQKTIDVAIENFVRVCNKYLIMSQKEIVYEASEVEFYLTNKYNDRKVLLDELLSKLSSGEKQIISLFSKIYLSTKKEFIVLFDEPELSLSIFWQQLLLPDIYSSKRCKFLLSVTHSPFIFENEFANAAVGLKEYIKFH